MLKSLIYWNKILLSLTSIQKDTLMLNNQNLIKLKISSNKYILIKK